MRVLDGLRLASATAGAALMTVMTHLLLAQSPISSVSGTVRSASGKPLSDVMVTTGRLGVRVDSAGRYVLSLAPGRQRIFAVHIGFQRADTTIEIRPGEHARWDATLRESDIFKDYEKQQAAAAAKNAAVGHIDSVGIGLIRPDVARTLPLGVFGGRLFEQIAVIRGPDSNTILSPLSAGLALSLARFGARGSTASALDQLLGLTALGQDTVERRGAALMSDLARRTDVTLELANAIWFDTTVAPTAAFRASTARWRATATTLPLASERAVAMINHWADSVTHQKITSILSESLPDTARLFIANAVYFKGKWFDPFEKSETQSGDFALPSGKRIKVPRMSRTGNVGYWRVARYQGIRLPYRGGKVAMYVVLPDSGVSFESVVRQVRSTDWIPREPRMGLQPVHIVLPRFHAELETDLLEPLAKLGAGIALDCNSADFSAMAIARSNGRPATLCIGKALQKVYIDVDEEGTEAAAVTGLAMVTVTSAPPPPIEFVVDRPFLFVLRDETTGTDLFVGRIARP